MSSRTKLDLDKLTDQQVIDLGRMIVTCMTGKPRFSAPSPSLVELTAGLDRLESLLANRAGLLQQVQRLTLQVRESRNSLEKDLMNEADYVEHLIEQLPPDEQVAAIEEAGMSGAVDGPMPRIEGLIATQGDLEGAIDLSWNPIKRGVKIYRIEMSEDPAGQSGWRFCKNATKSKTAVTALVSGRRYWFRVSAEGPSGSGAASEVATKVAP
jgi:hypothetical protein